MKGALMLWITFLTFWMTCGVTGAPTKYLFTAPRNLWQGSREEFCISFHDDKDIQANYLVTLSLADESDVVLGNGTTNEEGRVCHHFKVPDLSGNHKLTLQTETTRILDTGFSATVKRVDSTEVEIHESALETFIQTDKPIYKPGETVKFRAMTINKDLKPWTGMVPLVTVKNPGDVRVMQWLNVENNKGLLSFEMPLSEDPPLGEWKITMLVEGKEHVQLFTVEEYVLPKYEVTITAPTFLLPTTETIQGTVCAKYTYGKPVKGKVEISVCFQDTSPYFYYYRSRDNSERPCANRIMDIDGCETYIVDGSELMLDSSNFSRYGNLMINATVTEHVTGISLNGTVKGPEMTFEAVKLKFEDDTHGYFKDAFPYYARVIVTKPDGSPAPGELIEIKADNYDPEFHLKRNFTSDDNGLVKFAIKTLPKDVNRLSFNARAPKYFQPYGRYHHIIKMYEPSSYHNAQKWFSPSNSYIHIPSVENKVKCGSTLDLDVLYSTTLDTRYKFFVQVLSKSHMVHHTHVKHHFKSHDAVNFNSLPDDMLLDPYTPPPRPTWLYPIDPIPYYDDPELGYKPEPENITISLDGVEGTAEVKPEPVPRENKTMELHRSCDMMAVQTCMMPVARINPGNVKEMCQVYETMEVCIKPHRTSCKGQLTSLASLKDMYNSMCKSKCDMVELSKCMEPMIKLEGNSMLQICKKFAELKTCIGPYWNDCKESTEIQSVSNVFDSYNTLCPEKKASKKEICTKLFRPNFNTSASVLPGDRMTASNTGDVDDCARACNKENKCLGFNYHIHGTCELFFKNYLTAKKDGVDYYERQCYTDDSKDIIKSTHVAKVKISIPITANMGPKSELLIYYVREDDETVAATLEFSVENCFDNKVEMKFDQDTVYPGNEVNINLKAAPGSLCSVGVVDKSINLLAGNHQITPDQIFGRFKEPNIYTSYWQDDKKYCDEKTHYDESLYQGDMYSYNYRSYESDSVDAIQAFRKMNLVVFTDLTLQTRPCKVQIHRPVYFSEYDIGNRGVAWRGQIQPDAARKESVTTEQIDSSDAVRSHFPETWLWSIYMIGDDGEVNVTSTIPHTITEWVGNSLCTNLDVGVGVSSVTGITAFQPFFLSFTLPYSAIRGETVPILVSVFNYMTECLVMQVALPTSKDFGIKGGANRVYTRCVCPGETRTIKYHVIPYTLGKIKVLATAESIPDDGTCGNNSVSVDGTGANDAVQRELLIEAEGIEKEYTATSYICPEGAEVTESMLLPLPSTDLVEDSARGYINIIGDIMGPALSNLKDLLQMPYGCGEQNMASFSPNIFALQYLGNTNQLLPKIEDEAKGYMRIGYQRQLKYRHDDGSYSAFGGTGSGSIWLTSFVVKCLGQSRPYISIDADDLNKSITWFRRQQLENGCFPKIGYTHSYYLKGGFSDRSNEASLTAFVLIAMLEAGIPSSDPSVIKAVRCLDVQDIPDTYTMAIMAYAYTLYDLRHLRRQQVIKMLDERATVKDGMKYWSRTEKKEDAKKKQKWYYTAVSAEVEMTAYALLAHVTGEQQNAATNARPMVMWLTKQRNPRGGFSSTQDTIVALQALARYATLVYQGGVNVSIEMMEKNKKNPDRTTTFSIDDDNTLVLQSERISILPSTLEAKVSGVGCAMVQANVKYNVYETPTSPTFDMKVSVYRAKDHANQCSRRTLSICVKFTGPGGVSNMAIVDVKMVTGWVPVKDSLKKLIVEKNDPTYIGVEKYEVDGSYVHIYFDQLDSTRKCFLVDVEQNIELSAPKPAQVKVYDYYETDFTLIVNYKIKTTCGTKEELPYISAEQYYNGILVDLPVDEIVQVRVPPRLEGSGLFRPISQQQTCPMCYKSLDTTSKIFKSMVCGSKKIYKVQTGRRGKYTLKMYANVRTKKKEVVNKFVKKNYNSDCTCDLMNGQKGKVLVFSERDTLDTKTRTLTINGSSKIVKVSKALEKAVWRLVRKKRCR